MWLLTVRKLFHHIPLSRLLPAIQVDYHLALRARQFIGNSVSSFSAMLILERRHSGRFAAYYK